MRYRLLGSALVLLLTAATPAVAQVVSVDARRFGMGGINLDRASLRPYNAAYRAVPPRDERGSAKITLPIPLGLIQVLDDSAAFDFSADYWNPFRFANYVLNLPRFVFLEVKEAPTPTNDVVFTIGKNELIVDLGNTRAAIPSDAVGVGGTTRIGDFGGGAKGFRIGVQGWLRNEAGFLLGDTLRAFLKDAAPAQPKTRYSASGDGISAAGFAPGVSYVGRLAGDSAAGFYLGASVRYYLGVAYGRSAVTAGFITGDTIFADTGAVDADLSAVTSYSSFGNSLGRGFGVDLGAVWITGPLEVGVGVTDIGATLKWADTQIDSAGWDTAGDSIATTVLARHVETETDFPLSWIANLTYTAGTQTTLGAQVLTTGRGTRVSVGGEHWLGTLALRAGVTRDQRKKMQYSAGAGVRFGPLGLDVGFFTHSNSFSDERGITMATSLSLY